MTDPTRQRVVVTGAGGFIASTLVEHLLASGYENVVAFLRYTSMGSLGWLDTLPADLRSRVTVVRGDIRDPWSVHDAMKGADAIFHLAALISIPYSYASPDAFVETNMRGTLNVLEAARRHQVGRVVVTSTSEVYGTAQRVPMDETHPLEAQSPYAATKIGADHLALSYHRSFGLPVVVLRPFNCYGPRQSTRAIIPTIIAQLAAGSDVIRVGALSPRRDFTYVTDTVRAFVAAATSPDAVGRVINAGSGSDVSIGELIERLQGIAGVRCKIEVENERLRPEASEVQRLLADSSRAQDVLQWRPQTSLDDGLRKTYAWFSDPANLRLYRAEEYRV